MVTKDGDKKAAGAGAIDRDIQGRLGEKLKDAYGEVLNEPVPDRFVDLLDKLSNSEALPGDSNSPRTGDVDGNE